MKGCYEGSGAQMRQLIAQNESAGGGKVGAGKALQ